MITNNGKLQIKRYLAGYVPVIGQSISIGINNSAEALDNTELSYEAINVPTNLVTYDFNANKLIFKASIPADFVGRIYEVGLFSGIQSTENVDSGSRILTTFQSAAEEWTPAAYSTGTTRLGAQSLSHTPAASATTTSTLSNIFMDLSNNSAADVIKVAANFGNGNTSSIRVRFRTTTGDYYDFSSAAQTAGYKIIEFIKGNATIVGNPSWNNITSIQVTTVSGSGGVSAVDFDSIRIDDKMNRNDDYVLVARKILTTPISSVDGQAQDIEFSLDINI